MAGRDVRARKRKLRAETRALASAPPSPTAAADALAQLWALEVWEGARTVSLYAACQHEPPLDALAAELAERGIELVWPRVEDEELVLRRAQPGALAPGPGTTVLRRRLGARRQGEAQEQQRESDAAQ